MVRGSLCLLAVLLCIAGSSAFAGGGWQQVHVRTIRIEYRTHDGDLRSADVLVPDWYGPDRHPALPLIISPHGRGVSADANAERWGDLPTLGAFAVVNPEGQGRRFARFSWGYAGQIDDLARMPEIVRTTLPWLRIDRSRVYAFGASMGGQESLLLLARHPALLAGVAVFDPVTNMAVRYRDFTRLACNRRCAQQWGGVALGDGLRVTAQEEIGGTPSSARWAYAARSPITYVRKIAFSGVPLQIWWSTRDRVVYAADQSEPFVRALRHLNPRAPLQTFVGRWPHSAAMHPHSRLIPALRAFGLFPTRKTSSIGAGPLHPLLPWHPARRDADGKLLAWYRPEVGLGYDHVLRPGWNFLEQRAHQLYLRYAVFDGSVRGVYWQHNPAFSNAAFVDSAIAWYPYSGDRRAIATVRRMLDYQPHTGRRHGAGRGRACRSRRAAPATGPTAAASQGCRGASTAAPSRTRSGSSGTAISSSTS